MSDIQEEELQLAQEREREDQEALVARQRAEQEAAVGGGAGAEGGGGGGSGAGAEGGGGSGAGTDGGGVGADGADGGGGSGGDGTGGDGTGGDGTGADGGGGGTGADGAGADNGGVDVGARAAGTGADGSGANNGQDGGQGEDEEEDDGEYEDEDDEMQKEEPNPEYLETVCCMEKQNLVVNNLKKTVHDRMRKCPRTICEEKELTLYKDCLTYEMSKLREIINDAIIKMSANTGAPWGPLPICTTLEEDEMPHMVVYQPGSFVDQKRKFCKCNKPSKELIQSYDMQEKLAADNAGLEGDRYQLQEELLSRDRVIDCLQQKMQIMQSEMLKLMCESQTHIDQMDCNKKSEKQHASRPPCMHPCKHPCMPPSKPPCMPPKKPPCTPPSKPPCTPPSKPSCKPPSKPPCPSPRSPPCSPPSMPPASPPCMPPCPYPCMTPCGHPCMPPCPHSCKPAPSPCSAKKNKPKSPRGICPADVESRLNYYKENTDELEKSINHMSVALNRLQIELGSVQKERQELGDYVRCEAPCAKSSTCPNAVSSMMSDICDKPDELQELRAQYTTLLTDFGRKDAECRRLADKLDEQECDCQTKESPDKVELEITKRRYKELQEEQEEFRTLIKEQAFQVEEYREKFLNAQQKVEEQKCLLESMDMNNKRIEDQINMEIERIKCKFQEKLRELAPLPRLLELEQIKVAEKCKQIAALEDKLHLACGELECYRKKFKEMQGSKSDDNWEKKYKKAAKEIADLQEKLDKTCCERDCLQTRIIQIQDELDTLRQESARIICRTKERAEVTKETMQNNINRLEIDLAQCRATTNLTLADRDESIRQMKCQLNVLCSNFDEAQLQIKSLKNQIVFLSSPDSDDENNRCVCP